MKNILKLSASELAMLQLALVKKRENKKRKVKSVPMLNPSLVPVDPFVGPDPGAYIHNS